MINNWHIYTLLLLTLKYYVAYHSWLIIDIYIIYIYNISPPAAHTPTHWCCNTRILRWRAWLNIEMLVVMVLLYAFIWTMVLMIFSLTCLPGTLYDTHKLVYFLCLISLGTYGLSIVRVCTLFQSSYSWVHWKDEAPTKLMQIKKLKKS